MLAREYHTPVTYWLDPDCDPHLFYLAATLIEERSEHA